MSMHERSTRRSQDITETPQRTKRRSQDITSKPRRRRRPESSGSLAPLFWILGIVVFLGVAGGVTFLLIKKKGGGQGENPDKGPAAPAVEPFVAQPVPPPPEQVSVLPPTKGKDPLNLSPKLQQAIAAIDQVEQGWRLADIEDARPFLKPEQNSAVVVYTAARMLPPKWEATPPDIVPYLLSPDQGYTEEQVTATSNYLKRVPQALAEARKLAGLPFGRFRIEYRLNFIDTPVEYVRDARAVGHLLGSDAQLRAHQGDGEGALESITAMLNAGRALSDEAVSICQLARIANNIHMVGVLERVLSTQKGPSEQSLRAVQALVEEEGSRPLFYQFARGERAGFHYLLTNVGNGEATIAAGTQRYQVTADEHAWYLDYMSKLVAAAGEPPQTKATKLPQLAAQLATVPRGVKGCIPAFDKFNSSTNTALARLRAASLAVALERYRLTNRRWPANLEALVPEYIKELPVDPYNGQPFKYATQPEGVTIYCPSGGVDNGGRFATLNGKDPSSHGFRLLEVSRRR
jgi:hypothetical protein